MTMPEMIGRSAIQLVALVLIGCADPAPTGPQTIIYSTSGCEGTCPVYEVTVSSDGTGIFTGLYFTAVKGERKFAVTPEQYAAFAGMLAPHRPHGVRRLATGEPDCNSGGITDLPGATVQWRDSRTDELSYYYGCNPAAGPGMEEALTAAPSKLPIADFIVKR